MRTPLLVLTSLVLLAACDEKPTHDTSATSATATVAPSTTIVPPTVTASASASAQPSASAAASPPADAKPMFGCKTKVGDAKLNIEVFTVAKGAPIATVKVDSKPARSFTASTQPHAATYTLIFAGYGESDKHPASEPAYVAGTTVLGRLVANGDKMEFFADKAGFPSHPAKDGPYVCEK